MARRRLTEVELPLLGRQLATSRGESLVGELEQLTDLPAQAAVVVVTATDAAGNSDVLSLRLAIDNGSEY